MYAYPYTGAGLLPNAAAAVVASALDRRITDAAEIQEARGKGLGAPELARALQRHHPKLQLRSEAPQRIRHSPRRAPKYRAGLLGRSAGVGGRNHGRRIP